MRKTTPRQHIEFRTHSDKKRISRRRFIALLLAILVLGGTLSVLVFLKNYNFNLKDAFGGEVEETTEPVTETKPSDLESTILLICAPDDRSRIFFMSLVRFRMPENEVFVYSFSPSEKVNINSQDTTIAECYSKSGINETLKAVRLYTGVMPSHYAIMNDTSFKVLADRYGEYRVTINPAIEYRGSNFTLVLPEGTQLLKGDVLLKYMRCIPEIDFEKGMLAQSGIILKILENALVPANSGDLISRYSYVANHIDTDISIVKFSSIEKDVAALMNSDDICFTTVSTAADFIDS